MVSENRADPMNLQSHLYTIVDLLDLAVWRIQKGNGYSYISDRTDVDFVLLDKTPMLL